MEDDHEMTGNTHPNLRDYDALKNHGTPYSQQVAHFQRNAASETGVDTMQVAYNKFQGKAAFESK